MEPCDFIIFINIHILCKLQILFKSLQSHLFSDFHGFEEMVKLAFGKFPVISKNYPK